MQIGNGKSGIHIVEYRFCEMYKINPTQFTKKFTHTIKTATRDHNRVLGRITPACDRPGWTLSFTAKGDIHLQEIDGSGIAIGNAIVIKGQKRA